ncbi:MAG: restriction endonuclease subunit S [Xanthomonadaceae bacterium]|nr:restriction endonuclease subunit S [Xanthomonadaceae bacterium]
MSYPVYGEYKATRWPEVGSIPRGWEARRLKFAATCNDETLPETTDPDFEMAYVDISSVDLVNGITAVEVQTFEKAPSRARRIVRDGDTLISTVRTYLKAIAPVEAPPENMIVSTGFAVVRPLGFIHSGFLGYALQNTAFIDAVVANSTGVSYPAINPTSLICLAVCYPKDKKEQQQIAAFLDWKTGQIDALITKKKELMDKLKEKRLAVITQAVTKGLNPAAPLRDSGIPWLGCVPEHWEVIPLGFLMTMSGGMTPSMAKSEYWEGEIPWVTPKDMKQSRISDSIDHLTEKALEETSISLIPVNAVLVVVRGMILAHSFPTAITEAPVTINQDMKALRCEDQLEVEFLFWCLTGLAKVLSNLAQESAHGTRKIETETLKKFAFPVPPLAEQNAIKRHLEEQLSQLDQLAKATEKTIARLTEYRTALITAATTGKIDVRQVAIPQQPATL